MDTVDEDDTTTYVAHFRTTYSWILDLVRRKKYGQNASLVQSATNPLLSQSSFPADYKRPVIEFIDQSSAKMKNRQPPAPQTLLINSLSFQIHNIAVTQSSVA